MSWEVLFPLIGNMVKAYLRYVHAAQFGVTASSSCNICFNEDAKVLFTGALENVNSWNPRQGTLVRQLSSPVVLAALARITQHSCCNSKSNIFYYSSLQGRCKLMHVCAPFGLHRRRKHGFVRQLKHFPEMFSLILHHITVRGTGNQLSMLSELQTLLPLMNPAHTS